MVDITTFLTSRTAAYNPIAFRRYSPRGQAAIEHEIGICEIEAALA
jgi:hypothetical protein